MKCSIGNDFLMDLDEGFPPDKWILDGRGWYEPEIYHAIKRFLRPGDVAVDVGANVGYFTCLMASIVGREGSVFSFEPGPGNLEKLRRNIEINAFNNVTVIPKPAWSFERDTFFYLSADDSSGNALWDPALWPENVKTQAFSERIKTKTTMVSKYAPHSLRLIKVDAEGAEEEILKGVDLSYMPVVIAEINPFGMQQMGSSPEKLREYMYKWRYEMFFLDQEGKLPKLIPRDTRLLQYHIINVLFATVRQVGMAWGEADG